MNDLKLLTESTKKTFFLDVLRGLAALYVLVGHARWLLWEGYTDGYKLHPEAYNMVNKILVYIHAFFGFGHEAVMLFFVLSGFVIHYSSYQIYLRTGSFSIKEYLYKRVKRIYPPFLFALLFTWIIDTTGKFFGYSIYNGTTDFVVINNSIHSDLDIQTFLSNLCMLQTICTNVWGSNGPLWSLMYEWWFYILYIPVFFINKKNTVAAIGVVGFIFIGALFIPLQTYKWFIVIQYFFAWYFGVIAADYYMGRIAASKDKLIFITLIPTFLVIATYTVGLKYMNDYYIALVFGVLIYLSLHYHMHLKHFQFLQSLSNFSYTLYVLHLPILVFMSGWLQQKNDGKLPANFGYVYLGIAISLLVAWAVHFLVERPFVKKNSISYKLGQ